MGCGVQTQIIINALLGFFSMTMIIIIIINLHSRQSRPYVQILFFPMDFLVPSPVNNIQFI